MRIKLRLNKDESNWTTLNSTYYSLPFGPMSAFGVNWMESVLATFTLSAMVCREV